MMSAIASLSMDEIGMPVSTHSMRNLNRGGPDEAYSFPNMADTIGVIMLIVNPPRRATMAIKKTIITRRDLYLKRYGFNLASMPQPLYHPYEEPVDDCKPNNIYGVVHKIVEEHPGKRGKEDDGKVFV